MGVDKSSFEKVFAVTQYKHNVSDSAYQSCYRFPITSLQKDLATNLAANDFLLSTAGCLSSTREHISISTHALDGTLLYFGEIVFTN